MSGKPELSLLRPRFLTLVVLIAAAAAIVVANVSRDEIPLFWPTVPPPPPKLTYGWPVSWYWCQFKPSSRPPRTRAFSTVDPVVVEWSGARLSGNLAIWSALFTFLAVACQCLVRRLFPPFRVRVRMATIIVSMAVAAPILLANLSCGDVPWSQGNPALFDLRCSYGWPLIWRWRNIVGSGYGGIVELDENYSAARLIGNLAMWLVMLGAVSVTCEWLLRRYRPRLRWSLRTMFAAVALVAALSAWCVALRDRADKQDPIISVALNSPAAQRYHLHFERWGPNWLDLIGAGRFRRVIVGADVAYFIDGDEAFLKELARLASVRYLTLSLEGPARTLPAVLAFMPHLRTLRLGDSSHVISEECLAAVGKLTQLEELHLEGMIDGDGLAHLAGLANLKSLSLQIYWDADEEMSDNEPEPPRHRQKTIALLEHLPVLPGLKIVDLRGDSTVGERDLRSLALLPRLRSLNLSDLYVTDAGMAELAALNTVDELALGGDNASPAGLRALLAMKRLKVLHILRYSAVTDATKAELLNQESLLESAAEMLEEEMLEEKEMREEEEEMADDEALDDDNDMSDDETESVDEAQAEQRPMLPVRWQLADTVKRLFRLRVDWHGSYDNSDRLTTVALDHGNAVYALESEVDDFRRALDALRQANPGIVIDSDPKWFDANRGEIRRENPYSWCGGP
jgi:hypothetical protein